MAFESITLTDGEEEMGKAETGKVETPEEKEKERLREFLLLKAKQRVEEYWKRFEKSFNNIEIPINTSGSQKLTPGDVTNIISRISTVVELYESENKLKNTINGLPEYFEFRKELEEFKQKLEDFREILTDKGVISSLSKDELARQFKMFKEDSTMVKLKTLAEHMDPAN